MKVIANIIFYAWYWPPLKCRALWLDLQIWRIQRINRKLRKQVAALQTEIAIRKAANGT